MCCGSQRAAARAAAMATAGRPAALPATVAATSLIVFEYLGGVPAVIRGPASGLLYRFAHAGDRVTVDARDRPGLAQLAALRWVR